MLWLVVPVTLLATACGSSSSDAGVSPSPTTATSATSASSSDAPAAGTVALNEICPQVEYALPAGVLDDSSDSVSLDDLSSFLTALAQYQAEGDTESDAAIGPLDDAVDQLVTRGAGGKQPTGAQWEAIDSAIHRLAARCAAVGSSAFAGD